MNRRVEELDYLKCIFIVLMVAFHLVYFSELHPYAKRIVYTFHMPAFFVISGYLLNVGKGIKAFFSSMLWIFIPYAFMEMGYVVMSSVLPVRERVAEVSAWVLFQKTFIGPMGPYWYLHTLILCSVTCYAVYRILSKFNQASRLIITGLCFAALSYGLHILSFPNAMYFMAGVIICQTKQNFVSVFQPTFLSIIPLALLCCFPENLDRATLAGIAITYLAISFSLYLYRYTSEKIKRVSCFTGRNTFVILLFSPVFTILSKAFIPLFAFDSTGLIFMSFAVVFTIGGCFALAWLSDKLRLSRYCFGRAKIVR